MEELNDELLSENEVAEVSEEETTVSIDDQFNVTEEKKEKPEESTVSVRYNHKNIEIPVSEAAVLVQKGMQSEQVMDRLRMLAASRKCGVNKLVEELLASDENEARKQFLSKTNGDEELTDRLMEIRQEDIRIKASATPGLAMEKQIGFTERMANELEALMDELPELSNAEDIPDAVFCACKENKTPLALEYYRYAYGELAKIGRQKEIEEAAAGATAGSLFDPAENGTTPEIEAMMAGIWAN